jgi:hypothetical protein
MPTFETTDGKKYTVDLTIGDIKRVRAAHGIDLMQIATPKTDDETSSPLVTIASDLLTCLEIVYTIVEAQADAHGVTDEQFGAAMGGTAAGQAQRALMEALVNFFQGAGMVDLAQTVVSMSDMLPKMREAGAAKVAATAVASGQKYTERLANLA